MKLNVINPLKYDYLLTHDSLKLRYAYTENQGKPLNNLILLLHGRAEFIEKYKDIVKYLNNKGFDVVTFDWRGQGLSQRETANRQKGYVRDFNDYLLDLKTFFDQIIQPRGQTLYMLSHSMGGHIGLRFLHDYPNIVKRAVFVSPMFNINSFLLSQLLTRNIARTICASGFSENFVFSKKRGNQNHINKKKNMLSHDPAQINIQAKEIKKNPDLALGGVTWGWLNAAYNSIDLLLEKKYAHTINTPVLIVNAQEDKLVKKSTQKKIHKRLPDSSFISIKNAYHEILFETQDIRNTFWDCFDEFINPS